MNGPEPYISTPEAARLCGYSAEHVRRLCVSGKIQAHKVGKTWLTTETEVRGYIEKSLSQPLDPAEISSAGFSYLTRAQKLAGLAVALVVILPSLAHTFNLSDKLTNLKTQYEEIIAGTFKKSNKDDDKLDKILSLLEEKGLGEVAGSTIARSEATRQSSPEIATPTASARDGNTFPSVPQVLGISNDEIIAAFRATLAEGLPQDILVQLKGEKGDPGVSVSYTLPTSTNTSSMGNIAGFTHLGGQDLSTQNLTVTNNITQTGGTASFTTLTVAGEDVVTLAGIQTLTNKTLTAPTLTSPIITNIAPGANFTLTQNSVVPFTSVESGAVANTLYLSSGNVGIGTNNPNVKLDVSGHLRVMNQNEIRFADQDSSNYVGFKSSTTVGANTIWTLPSADASGCFQSNGAGLISIASCGGEGALSAGGLTNDFRGLQLRTHSDCLTGSTCSKVVLVHADEIVTKDGTRHTPANNLSADITVAGAGGLRAGQTEAASTWYKIMYAYGSSGETVYLEQAKDYFLDEQQTTDNGGKNFRTAANREKLGQTFDTDVTGPIEFVDIKVVKSGTVTGRMWVSIYAASGGTPTGSALKTSDKMDVSLISTTAQVLRFVFRDPYSVTAGTTYALVLEGDYTLDPSNFIQPRVNTGNGYAAGKLWAYDSSSTTWTDESPEDLYFKIYVTRNDNVPVPPSGYNTSYAHIGWVKNNDDSNFGLFAQYQRRVQPLEGGANASITATNMTLTELASDNGTTTRSIPPGPIAVRYQVQNSSAAQNNNVGPVPNGYGFFNNGGDRRGGVAWAYNPDAGQLAGLSDAVMTEYQAVYMRVSGGTGTFFLSEWEWFRSDIGTPAGAGGSQVWLLNDQNEAYYSTANVGIGTSNPDSPLHVQHATAAQLANLVSVDDLGYMRIADDTDNLLIGVDSDFGFIDIDGGAYELTLKNGSVGIGTTNPDVKLHVSHAGDLLIKADNTDTSGNAAIQLKIASGNETGDPIVRFTVDGEISALMGIDQSDSNKFKFANSAFGTDDRLIIDTSGNVGIGTAGPARPLHISPSSGGDAVIRLERTSTGVTGEIAAPHTSEGFVIRTYTNHPIRFATNTTSGDWTTNTRMIIAADGNVGIGTTNLGAGARLEVWNAGGFSGWMQSSAASVLGLNRTGDDGNVLNIYQDGNFEGGISISGTTVLYNAFTGAHYGWTEETIERGMLVSFTGHNKHLHDNPNSEIIYGITKTAAVNDPKVLGSYSSLLEPSKPADLENPSLVMAVGNGDLWVADMGEDLEPGDYLISSSVPGHAMKDTGEYYPAYIIARVAEPVDWNEVTETVDGKKHKKISVTYDIFRSGRLTVDQAASGQIITAEGDYDANGFSLLNVKAVTSLSGKWSIDENGVLVAEKVKTKIIEIEDGITIKDKLNGQYYCVYFENGIMQNKPNACDAVEVPEQGEVAGESTPNPEPEPEPAPGGTEVQPPSTDNESEPETEPETTPETEPEEEPETEPESEPEPEPEP